MRLHCASANSPVAVINLDPANDNPPYTADIDIRQLITLQDVMDRYSLGPNGGLLFAMEYIETNLDWLLNQLSNVVEQPGQEKYVLFDLPGQIELFTHHKSLQRIISQLSNPPKPASAIDPADASSASNSSNQPHHKQRASYRLTAVHCVDIIHAAEASQFISVLLLSLSAQLHLECPHINLLTKIDLLKNMPLPMGLEFYSDVLDLEYLLSLLDQEQSITGRAAPERDDDDPQQDGDDAEDGEKKKSTKAGKTGGRGPNRWFKLNEIICDLVTDYGHTAFVPIAIEDKESVHRALQAIDKANGYAFSGMDTVYANRLAKAQNDAKKQQPAAAASSASKSSAKSSKVGKSADELRAMAAHPLFTAVNVDTNFDYFRSQSLSDQYEGSANNDEHMLDPSRLTIRERDPTSSPADGSAADDSKMTDVVGVRSKSIPLSAQPPPPPISSKPIDPRNAFANRTDTKSSSAASSTSSTPFASSSTIQSNGTKPSKGKQNKSSAIASTTALGAAKPAPSRWLSKPGAPPPTGLRFCAHCSIGGSEFKRCGRCRSVHYCSTECQSNDWPTHKGDCKPPQQPSSS